MCRSYQPAPKIDGLKASLRATADHCLQRLLAQAHRYRELVLLNGEATIGDLATQAGVGGSYFTRALKLGFLAPDIVKTIIQDRHPLEVAAKRLARDLRVPCSWDEQRAQLGLITPAAR